MLDIKYIRDNPEKVNEILKQRGTEIDLEKLLFLDKQKREIITLVQNLQNAKNQKSSQIARSYNNITAEQLSSIKKDIKDIDHKIKSLNNELENINLNEIIDYIPNLPSDEVPVGSDESMNKLIKRFKGPKNIKNPKQHFEIGSNLKEMDFKIAANISGSRFVILKNQLAKLERALINFMIDTHTEKYSYTEISPPTIVRSSAMYNAGQLPKFGEDSYLLHNSDMRLIPTAEVPLTNMVANSILDRDELPLRYVAYTKCFRSEAGSAGRDTRGMFRNHEFGKVELVTICNNNRSKEEHEHMLYSAEYILRALDLPYRVMLLCTGDMGFSAEKTFDIEVWLPGQDKYREISSISNCGDFQARRMKARYRTGDNIEFVHTLNGSALAVGRTIVAILENYQNADGSVTVPDILVPYMKGVTKIELN